MSEPSLYHLRQWQSRASTILRKAEALQSDMIAALTAEHALTAFTDDVVCRADSLVECIECLIDLEAKGSGE